MSDAPPDHHDLDELVIIPKLTASSLRLVVQSLAVGVFVWCGVLTLVIEEFFKPKYALWMIGSSLALVILEALLRAFERRRDRGAALEPPARPWYDVHRLIYGTFVGVITVWLAMELGSSFGLYHYAWSFTFRSPLFVWGLPSALLWVAGSGLRFGAHGRRYSLRHRLIALRHVVQSVVAGAALFHLLTLVIKVPSAAHFALPKSLAALLVVHLFFIASVERVSRRRPGSAAQASGLLLQGRYATWFWGGGIVLGHLLPVLIAARDLPKLDTFAVLSALFGVYAYQHAFVLADRRALAETTNPIGGDDSGPDFP
jgi:hypothetical protein